MSFAPELLKTHPHQPPGNAAQLAACIQACFDCGQACTACADACLGESALQMLVRCIRLNLDCADVCLATGRMLSRSTEPPGDLLRRQLDLCVEACRVCGAECDQHAHHHEHCAVCARACRACEAACRALLVAVPSAA